MDNYNEMINRAFLEGAVIKKEDYEKQLLMAQKKVCKTYVEQFIKANPKKDEESQEDYDKKVIEVIESFKKDQPNELERNMRVYAQFFGTLFTEMQMVINEIQDFKNLYVALNQQKLQSIANKATK